MKKSTAAKKSPATSKAVVKSKPKAEVFTFDGEISGKDVWEFINTKAGGNPNNVVVVPLGNVNVDDDKPTPFGYTRQGGTRAMFHDFHVKGVEGDFRLGNMLDKMRKTDGHSKQRMICTVALLNGGYSTSSAVWGTPFISLQVQK